MSSPFIEISSSLGDVIHFTKLKTLINGVNAIPKLRNYFIMQILSAKKLDIGDEYILRDSLRISFC